MSEISNPIFHWSHIFSSPGTTLAGVAWMANTLGSQFATGVPTSSAGWLNFGFNALMSVGMALAKQ